MKFNSKVLRTLSIFLLSLLCLVSFVIAAHIITTNTGATAWSFNEDLASAVYNFSVNNTDGGFTLIANITDVNVTIPSTFTLINYTNGTTAVGRFIVDATSTTISWRNSSLNGGLVNGSNGSTAVNAFKFFWFNATASTPGIYNITVSTFGSNGTALIYSNTNLTVRINDTTVPVVFAENISLPIPHSNHTSEIIMNISVFDNSIINSVKFNITNVSGQQAQLFATNLAGNTWNGSFSSSSLADGAYNVSAVVNDTYGGNVNNTAFVRIVVDNTDPSATASCSPSSVSTGANFPCSCSATDATTGVRITSESSTSPDGNSTPTNTGTFTFTCTATDYAGNSGVDTADYTVTGAGGSSGGSSGSGSSGSSVTWTATYAVSNTDLQNGVTRDLGAKKRLEIEVNGEKHHVGVVSVSSSSVVISVASTPVEKTMSVGQTEKFELTNDNYYDLSVSVDSISGSQAKVTVKTINEEIASVPSTPVNEPTQTAEESKSNLMWWIVGIILVLVVVGIIFYTRKNHRK